MNIKDIKIEDLDNFENIEQLQFPEEMEDPKKVFGDLLKFYDEKIQNLTNKIQEEESKKIDFNRNFLQKDERISRYLDNPKFMKKFNLKKHQDNAQNEINKLTSEKNEVIEDLKKYRKEMEKQKKEFLEQQKGFESLYNNYDKIKLAYKKKTQELSEMKKNDRTKYDEEILKIKERIKNNLNHLNNMFDPKKMEENDNNIKKLKDEANAYHNEMMIKKFEVRTETYTEVKRSFSFLGVVLGVVGAVIGGVVGGVTGGVTGALSGIAIGACGGYGLGSFIESGFK
jgi:chromosome segregation ATPase